jgi:tRNA/tmRNA/rRNA uracil-C5-methylase (TrmA/RlmC/RlmD family)
MVASPRNTVMIHMGTEIPSFAIAVVISWIKRSEREKKIHPYRVLKCTKFSGEEVTLKAQLEMN